jgi:hypothetical protein
MNIPDAVFTAFEEIALSLKTEGFTQYSADSILHRIRWHYNVEIGNRSFKANNNWTPVLARWLIAKNPEFATFFQLRHTAAMDFELLENRKAIA